MLQFAGFITKALLQILSSPLPSSRQVRHNHCSILPASSIINLQCAILLRQVIS